MPSLTVRDRREIAAYFGHKPALRAFFPAAVAGCRLPDYLAASDDWERALHLDLTGMSDAELFAEARAAEGAMSALAYEPRPKVMLPDPFAPYQNASAWCFERVSKAAEESHRRKGRR